MKKTDNGIRVQCYVEPGDSIETFYAGTGVRIRINADGNRFVVLTPADAVAFASAIVETATELAKQRALLGDTSDMEAVREYVASMASGGSPQHEDAEEEDDDDEGCGESCTCEHEGKDVAFAVRANRIVADQLLRPMIDDSNGVLLGAFIAFLDCDGNVSSGFMGSMPEEAAKNFGEALKDSMDTVLAHVNQGITKSDDEAVHGHA